MNAAQMLTALDAAAAAHAAADARRVLRAEANNLRARIQRATRAAKLRKDMAKLSGDESNQGAAHRATLAACLRDIGPSDVGPALAEARRVLALWS